MIFVSDYTISSRKNGVLYVESSENPPCRDCRAPLKHRDWKQRISKLDGGKVQRLMIERRRCTNPLCRHLHNVLPDKTGTITITPKAADDVVKGMSFTLYQVAGIVKDGNNQFVYELTDAYKDSGIELGEISVSARADSFAEYTRNHLLEGTTKTADESGTVSFTDLPLGLYLIMETGEGGYTVVPFLVSVPSRSSANDAWQYDVDASPKAEIVPTAIPTPDITPETTPTISPEPSLTPGPSGTPAPSGTPDVTPEATPAVSPSVTPEVTPSVSPTVTPSATLAASVTPEISNTPSTTTDTSSNTSTPNQKLMQTGQLNWPVPVLAVCGLLLFAIGWAIRNLKNK